MGNWSRAEHLCYERGQGRPGLSALLPNAGPCPLNAPFASALRRVPVVLVVGGIPEVLP